jgi:cobalt-zinc-cadmium efflux system protein
MVQHSHGHHDGDGGHNHHHSGHHHFNADSKLSYAALINVVLTVAQIVAGVLSGSLALVADALHNLSDAAAMILALVARKIARRHADDKRTYGYKKVETLAAFTNFLTLIIIGLWLAYEAIIRFFSPQEIEGWTVIIVAGLAIVINGATAWLTYHESKNSQNIRAAFLHNLTDMVSSIGVVIAGVLILAFGWTWVDPLITLVISAYVLMHAAHDLPKICNILIDGAPDDIQLPFIIDEMKLVDGVADVHHVHVRYLDEHSYALEAHIVAHEGASQDVVKDKIKQKLAALSIDHSTLEFEDKPCQTVDCGAAH